MDYVQMSYRGTMKYFFSLVILITLIIINRAWANSSIISTESREVIVSVGNSHEQIKKYLQGHLKKISRTVFKDISEDYQTLLGMVEITIYQSIKNTKIEYGSTVHTKEIDSLGPLFLALARSKKAPPRSKPVPSQVIPKRAPPSISRTVSATATPAQVHYNPPGPTLGPSRVKANLSSASAHHTLAPTSVAGNSVTQITSTQTPSTKTAASVRSIPAYPTSFSSTTHSTFVSSVYPPSVSLPAHHDSTLNSVRPTPVATRLNSASSRLTSIQVSSDAKISTDGHSTSATTRIITTQGHPTSAAPVAQYTPALVHNTKPSSAVVCPTLAPCSVLKTDYSTPVTAHHTPIKYSTSAMASPHPIPASGHSILKLDQLTSSSDEETESTFQPDSETQANLDDELAEAGSENSMSYCQEFLKNQFYKIPDIFKLILKYLAKYN